MTEERFSVLGVVVEQRSRHKARAPRTDEVEILTRDLRGSRAVGTYSVAPGGGTVVEVEGDSVLGRLFSLVRPFMVRPVI